MRFTSTVPALLLFFIGSLNGWGAEVSSMLETNSTNTNQQWRAIPVFTVGDKIAGYTAPGRLDGIGIFAKQKNEVRILVNHEIKANLAYPYKLANGTELTGARISFFDIQKESHKNNFRIIDAGLAYDQIVDREAKLVSQSTQINEENSQKFNGQKGLSRFCSGRSVKANTLGFSDDVFFAGEETSINHHPHGGSMWVLNVNKKTLHAVPDLGRGAWENLTPIESGRKNTVTLLMGDDSGPAPLYLYIGITHPATGREDDFLSKNGLSGGQLSCWAPTSADTSPQSFNTTGSVLKGYFISIDNRDRQKANKPGYDQQGYPDSNTLKQSAFNKGCFQFSRLEDLHNDPATPGRAVFADTGQGRIHPANDWGSVHIIDIDFDAWTGHKKTPLAATIRISYDSDDEQNRDEGIRSPDNLTWAGDGMIYVQEDRASRLNTFAENGIEASIWQLNPSSSKAHRIAIINRDSILPADAVDKYSGVAGAWETSGILDVSRYFDTATGETLLLTAVQAHKLKGGQIIGGRNKLVESGQLIFLTNKMLQNE